MHIFYACFFLFFYILKTLVDIMNYRHRHEKCPDNVRDIYDPAAYDQWYRYTMLKFKTGLIQGLVNTSVLVALLATNSLLGLETYVGTLVSGRGLQALVFLGALSVVSSLMNLPFSCYNTFVIEARFGFNRTSLSTYVVDGLKHMVLNLILGGGMVLGVHKLVDLFEGKWVSFGVCLWAVACIFLVFFMFLYTKVFIRLFNKLSALEAGPLKDKIETMANAAGFNVKAIWLINASKRSSKLNAFFSGFGRWGHIVLYDTLLEKMTHDEIVSILAHELGHAVHKDVLKGLIKAALSSAIYIMAFVAIVARAHVSLAYGLIIMGIVFTPVNILVGLVLNKLSRTAEYKADAYAGCQTNPHTMVMALKTLARENFANLTPHPCYVALHASHPTISDRIQALDRLESSGKN